MRNLLARYAVEKLAVNVSASGTPVTTSAWTVLTAATSAPACALEICNTSGRILKLSLGQVGEEDLFEINYFVLPGGSPILLPMEVPRGARVSAKALDADTDEGYIVINSFG